MSTVTKPQPKKLMRAENKDRLHRAMWRAIELMGGPVEVAKDLGLNKSAFYQWGYTPDVYVLYLERMSGISRHVLRPDIFGRNCKEGRCGNH